MHRAVICSQGSCSHIHLTPVQGRLDAGRGWGGGRGALRCSNIDINRCHMWLEMSAAVWM